MRKFTTYYMGVYLDYHDNERIFQVSDSVDSLSPELLAEPKVLAVDYGRVKYMINSAKEFARLHRCQTLEINCSKGKGSYGLISVK